VADLTTSGPSVERELALVKVSGDAVKREEARRIAESFRARIVDSGRDSLIFEITGKTEKVKAFIDLMEEFNLVELVRTGVAALTRGAEKL